MSNYGTIERSIAILKAFLPHNHGVGTLELSKKLDINKSTISRILKVMVSHELVYKDPKTKKFVLGNLAVSIGNAALRSINERIVSISKPHIDELRDQVNEPVGLEVVSGNSTMIGYLADTHRAFRVFFDVGTRMPPHASAGAKAILAFSSAEVVDTFLEGDLPKLTNNTITNKKEIKRQLEEIRRTGLAFDFGEIENGIDAISAPVFNREGIPVAAIVIAVPTHRGATLTETKEQKLLKKAAKEISSVLNQSRTDD